jgi:hypothetical protein
MMPCITYLNMGLVLMFLRDLDTISWRDRLQWEYSIHFMKALSLRSYGLWKIALFGKADGGFQSSGKAFGPAAYVFFALGFDHHAGERLGARVAQHNAS